MNFLVNTDKLLSCLPFSIDIDKTKYLKVFVTNPWINLIDMIIIF